MALPPMLTARYRCGAAAVDGFIYVAGGYSDKLLASVERYDPNIKCWEEASPMATPRLAFAMAAINGAIYAAGGADAAHRPLSRLECLNCRQELGDWVLLSQLRIARHSCAGTVADGKLYVAGGIADGSSSIDSVERFLPDSNTWEAMSRLSQPRRDFAMAASGGAVYVFGGVTYGGRRTAFVERFNGDKWEGTMRMPMARTAFAVVAVWC